jgi:hypothetical protein
MPDLLWPPARTRALPCPRTGPSVERATDAAACRFVRVEIRHPDGQMAALTNPIFLT